MVQMNECKHEDQTPVHRIEYYGKTFPV